MMIFFKKTFRTILFLDLNEIILNIDAEINDSLFNIFVKNLKTIFQFQILEIQMF